MFLGVIVFGLLLPISLNTDCGESKVTKAVSPFYSATPAANGMQGDVSVEVDVAPTGGVRSVRTITGNKLLASEALVAARRWEFSPCDDETLRNVILKFRFVLLNASSPEKPTSVFFPPYTVEVRTVRPKLGHTRAITDKPK